MTATADIIKTYLNCGREWRGTDSKPETCSPECEETWQAWWAELPSYRRASLIRPRQEPEKAIIFPPQSPG